MTTILLVEDAHDLAQVIIRELEASSYHVLHASDGQAALQLYAREQPALVVLDWMLPGLDGLEVLHRLRQSAPTPVLMLTARGEETDRVLGLELPNWCNKYSLQITVAQVERSNMASCISIPRLTW